MPRIVDYATVLATLAADGLRCVYPNGGAFAFADPTQIRHVGLLIDDDPTLRPEARAWTKRVSPPTVATLANHLIATWIGSTDTETETSDPRLPHRRSDLADKPTPLWIFPKSHWAHELHHGAGDWLRDALVALPIDVNDLANRTTADAVVFESTEAEAARSFIAALLTHLIGSDFSAAFPGHAAYCSIHHHRQLWWSIRDDELPNNGPVVLPMPRTGNPPYRKT